MSPKRKEYMDRAAAYHINSPMIEKPLRNIIKRVDIQASVLTAVIVAFALSCLYFFSYYLTYEDMIHSLKDRCSSLFHYVESGLTADSFTKLSAADDADSPNYISAQKMLSRTRATTGVRYLYTAKRDDEGRLIYLVDGLPTDTPDFRYPGDTIEEENVQELSRALDGETVMPNRIKNTSWGPIFLSYFPIWQDGKVIGAVGIEFDAQHQYNTFQKLRIGTPLIAAAACLTAFFISFKLFKRISNPGYRDLANSDYLTGLKNRNAFEVDICNYEASREQSRYSVLSADLNGLKRINDTFGHQAGDGVIRQAAAVLRETLPAKSMLYRVGGDEFVGVMRDQTPEQLQALSETICENVSKAAAAGVPLSLSVGYAVFDAVQDRNLLDTCRRADAQMYAYKKSAGCARP